MSEHIKDLSAALTAPSDLLFQLILDSDPIILKALLYNPNLTDDHLLTLLKRRDLPQKNINLIYRRRKNNLSHALILALVKNPMTSGSLIRNLLPQLRLFELVDLCYLPGVTPDQRLAAERMIIQRLPTTPLGNKITLARRATSPVVNALLKEGDSPTVEVCLDNSKLKEAAVFQLINSPRSTATTIAMVARNNRWHQRPNLRMAILKNPNTPTIWFTLWLPHLPITAIKQLFCHPRNSIEQKRLIKEELKRRRH